MEIKLNRRFSGALDLARWIAAFSVVITHAANIMVARIAYSPATARSPMLYLWVLLGGFGHQSVTIFFILSGYLVGGRLLERVQRTGSIEWKRYFIDRVVRIELVLIPALILTFVCDRLASRYLPGAMQPFLREHASWGIFFGNIANLQNFYVVFFGSDGPIGTLANEFWYYFTFPLLLAPLLSARPRMERVLLFVSGLALCFIFWWPQHSHLLGFLLWLMGVLVAASNRAWLPSVRWSTALVLLTLLLIRAVMRREYSENMWYLFFADLVLSVAFANLMLALRFAPDPKHSWCYSPLHTRLAGFSFSLYACHMPLLFLAAGFCKVHFGFGTADVIEHASQWFLIAAAIAFILIATYLFSLLTEHNTAAVRHAVYRLFHAERATRSDGPGTEGVMRHPALGQESGQ